MAEASLDPELRTLVVSSLGTLAPPSRTNLVARLIAEGDIKNASERVTPSELFKLARDLAPKRNPESSCVLAELRQLGDAKGTEVNYSAIPRAFATLKPTLPIS